MDVSVTCAVCGNVTPDPCEVVRHSFSWAGVTHLMFDLADVCSFTPPLLLNAGQLVELLPCGRVCVDGYMHNVSRARWAV